MNTRAKNQFKTWQRLPELGAKRPEAANSQAERLACRPRTMDRGPAAKKDGARSQILKFIFTTHD